MFHQCHQYRVDDRQLGGARLPTEGLVHEYLDEAGLTDQVVDQADIAIVDGVGSMAA
ncbi:hypothetical protein D3C80_2235030 [compost metagenome]